MFKLKDYVSGGFIVNRLALIRQRTRTGRPLVGESPGRLLIAFTPAGKIQEWFERDRKKGEYVNDEALYHAFGMELLGPPLSLK